MKPVIAAAIAAISCLAFTLTPVDADAKTRHQTAGGHHRRGGSCDGIHRCRCGSTQAAFFGLPRIFHGHNLWLASEWPRAFPRTTLRAGAVGHVPGHVFRVVQPLGAGKAIVADDKGQYERRISNAIFVAVR